WECRRPVHRLDAAARARSALSRGPRQERSVAVQERAGTLVRRGALSAGSVLVANRDNPQDARTGGQLDRELVVEALAHECLTEWRVHADEAGRPIELIRPDDAVALRLARGCGERYPGPEEY